MTDIADATTVCPQCPSCDSEYSYEMGDLLVCTECGHEWPKVAEVAE